MGPFREDWTVEDIEAVLARGNPQEMLYIPIVVSLSSPDLDWSEAVCVRLADHPHPAVRGNAILGLGHLARVCRRLNEAMVRPIIEQALQDECPEVRGKARDAADELATFLGWKLPARRGGMG